MHYWNEIGFVRTLSHPFFALAYTLSQYLHLPYTTLLQAMRVMNKKLNMPQLTHIMREFERQNEKMEMTSDMMGDTMDDAMGVRLLYLLNID